MEKYINTSENQYWNYFCLETLHWLDLIIASNN